jgi:starch synthase
MRVAFVTSEVHPFSKTGGLADVARALPKALNAAGVATTVFSPLYRSVRDWMAAAAGVQITTLDLPHKLSFAGQPHGFRYRCLTQHGTSYVFVENDALFDRERLYVGEDGRDYPDNVVRFAFFCQSVVTYCGALPEPPTIVHANDWQAALLPIYLKTVARDVLPAVRSVLTVHNLGYQGIFAREQLPATGLGWNLFHPEALEFYDQLNLLKGGIVFADAVTTVSPTYAQEIQAEEQGAGLHGVMRAHAHKLRGILNGIDIEEWNPKTDSRLPAHFDRADLKGKASCKSALQWRMKVAVRSDAFLLGVVSRLDHQKGIHLIVQAMEMLGDRDIQLVTLGTGSRDLEDRLRVLATAHPERVSVVVGFDESLAHLIEAGADAFLMPSAYEPCGLNQMYSQRYGTVPIVRETGGLCDTVVDYTAAAVASNRASGFTFRPLAAAPLVDAISRAEQLYRSAPAAWRALITDIMGIDRSWQQSARAYRALYEQIEFRSDS